MKACTRNTARAVTASCFCWRKSSKRYLLGESCRLEQPPTSLVVVSLLTLSVCSSPAGQDIWLDRGKRRRGLRMGVTVLIDCVAGTADGLQARLKLGCTAAG